MPPLQLLAEQGRGLVRLHSTSQWLKGPEVEGSCVGLTFFAEWTVCILCALCD